MNILMMTNTYKPILGGLEKSVEIFTNEYRKRGHRVIIVAPEFEGMEPEVDVTRAPAIQKVGGTEFSIHFPTPGVLTDFFNSFKPDIIHSHHPFMLGNSALRAARSFKVPLIYTYHTSYEKYTDYVPGKSMALKRFM